MAEQNKGKKPIRLITGRTLFIASVCGIVAFIVLVAQLYKVMIVKHEEYQSKAVEQQVRETTVTAARGTIYDTNMKILAKSASVDTIYISPAEMKIYEEDASMIASKLSEILGVSYDRIMEKWTHTSSWYETVAVKVEQEISSKVREFKNENDLKSVHIMEDSKRYYPYSNLASQIIGFVGAENTGLEGIEAVYEKYLRGVNGRIVRATTERGTDMLFTGYEDYYDAQDGNSLVLTIDSTIQYYLEKHLAQAIEDYDIQNGAMGIAMDVNTGAVLGMTSLPNYDLNNFLEVNADTAQKIAEMEGITDEEREELMDAALAQQWRNRVITDTYEPGSTFKIITLASALEEGIVTESDSFYCGGSMNVLGRTDPLHCWDHSGHGSQTLAQAAQHSCNVAFVTIGLRLGAEKFYDYMEAFGFFDTTGIDLYGEQSGLWWSDEVFKNPDNQSQLASASFGQTFNITPLQLITAVSAVANGGNLMQPYVVRQILDPEGNVVESREPTVVRQVISEETSRRACEILESVVGISEGTGKNAYVAGYRIAGKTGTSEKVGAASDDYVVSFIGFAPADDPQIAVLILLDSPNRNSGIYISGGVMAAPVVGNIFADILPYIGVEPEYTDEESANLDVTLPNLKTLSIQEAKAELDELGFGYRVVGEGDTITDQLPVAGVKVATGSSIILYAGEEKNSETVKVPNVFGMTYSDAKYTLMMSGLYIHSTGVAPDEDSWTIQVARQSIGAEMEVPYGSVIEVTLIDTDSSIMETRAN